VWGIDGIGPGCLAVFVADEAAIPGDARLHIGIVATCKPHMRPPREAGGPSLAGSARRLDGPVTVAFEVRS